ncbi:hypothetical protein SAMN02910358_01320 [Lachnospiraceae bacterium XBB1006]|nr:hypothetical protein SAMN02910358_01320 [Lachnospiraceae bacterium XBB1006]
MKKRWKALLVAILSLTMIFTSMGLTVFYSSAATDDNATTLNVTADMMATYASVSYGFATNPLILEVNKQYILDAKLILAAADPNKKIQSFQWNTNGILGTVSASAILEENGFSSKLMLKGNTVGQPPVNGYYKQSSRVEFQIHYTDNTKGRYYMYVVFTNPETPPEPPAPPTPEEKDTSIKVIPSYLDANGSLMENYVGAFGEKTYTVKFNSQSYEKLMEKIKPNDNAWKNANEGFDFKGFFIDKNGNQAISKHNVPLTANGTTTIYVVYQQQAAPEEPDPNEPDPNEPDPNEPDPNEPDPNEPVESSAILEIIPIYRDYYENTTEVAKEERASGKNDTISLNGPITELLRNMIPELMPDSVREGYTFEAYKYNDKEVAELADDDYLAIREELSDDTTYTIYVIYKKEVVKPEDNNPNDPDPNDPNPNDPDPNDPNPNDPTPNDPNPSDPTPSDPTPSDPTPSDPTPSDPTPVTPAPVIPIPSDPTPSDPTPSDPTPTDPVVIEESEVPLSDAPEMEESTDIEEEAVAKNERPDVKENDVPDVTINDMDVPLSDTPLTDDAIPYALFALDLLAGLGLVALLFSGRRDY